MPSVHTEVEKMLLSSKKRGLVVETGYCYLNAQCTVRTLAAWEQEYPNSKQAQGNSPRCQVFGKKAKMHSFPSPCFTASPSTDLIWQPLLHGSQTHRPPRLRSKGPWRPLGDLSLVRRWNGLASPAASRAGVGRQACLWDVHSLCQRSGLQANPQKERGSV